MTFLGVKLVIIPGIEFSAFSVVFKPSSLLSGAVEKKGSSIQEAEAFGIQVVPESFIDECKNGGDAVTKIIEMNLATWGSDVRIYIKY